MADNYGSHFKRMVDPLANGELADFGAGAHTFANLPRALNCSAEGSLVVDMGTLEEQAIHVVAGLNPYRVSKIYASSDAITVVGMW